MKYLSTLILLATCSIIFAQSDLYVSDGSYVYVDGTAFTSGPNVAPLFVTDDVNLSTTGHIYLRNDAQLLQGTTTTTSTNTGAGKLSVYQTGTSNTYMYNLWASPVGIHSGGAGNTVFTPNVNFYDPIGNADPHLNRINSVLATYTGGYDGTATVTNTTPQIISEYWLYQFIGVTAAPNEYQDWLGLGGGSLPTGGVQSGQLASGYGFTMKGNSSGAQTYDFRGRPNNGTIGTTVSANLETLVGNPYPSAIDARAFLHGATANNPAVLDATATLLFWEQDPVNSTSHVLVNYFGGYATYTINATGAVVDTFTPANFSTYNVDGTLNTTGSASTSGKTSYRYIPIGQGFMVKGNGTGGTVEFTNDMRVFQKEAAGLSEFFRTTNEETSRYNNDEGPFYNEDGLCIMPDGYKRFRINIDFNETYTRQLTQTFHESATDEIDYGLETRASDIFNSDAYWPAGEFKLNAEAYTFNEEMHIPLVINVDQNQPLRFRILDVQNFNNNQPIFVHDIEADLYVDLRQQNYELNLPQGNYTDRFEIVFVSQSLSTQEFNDEDFLVIQNNNISQLTILNPNQLAVKSITLYDVSGKRIFNELDLPIKDRYEFSTKDLSEGVYITKVAFENQSSISKKIVISQRK